MSKTKTRQAVKAAKVTKATKSAKVRKPSRVVKAVKALTVVKSKAKRVISKKPVRPHHGKRPAPKPSPVVVVPEPEVVVVVKTVKWSGADVKEFRERLQKLHDMVIDDIGFLAGGHLANSKEGAGSKSSGYSQDRAEDGTENFAQDLALMQVSNKQDMLNKIDNALRRLEQRTYGACEECGELIARLRLEVQPFAARCIKCQSAAEANRPRSQGFRKSLVQIVDSELS